MEADRVHGWWTELRELETRVNAVREQVSGAAAGEPNNAVASELYFIDTLLTNMLEASSTVVRHLMSLENRL